MNASIAALLYRTMVRLLAAATALPFHEFAHAWVAHKLGDDTAKYNGRLTLNPFRHLEPTGFILMLLAGVGWAKPVPINPRNFKDPRKGMALSALAGPLSNVLLGYICMIFFKLFVILGIAFEEAALFGSLCSSLSNIFSLLVSINVGLAVFNLLPVPPLDGSRVLNLILPRHLYFKVMAYERYIMIGLLLVVYLGVLDGPLGFFRNLLYNLFDTLTGFMDSLLYLVV